MKYTIAERLAAGLEFQGWHEVHDAGRGAKYRKFARKGQDGKTYYRFLGPNGALRVGRNVSESVSMGDPGHPSAAWQVILKAGENRLNIKTGDELLAELEVGPDAKASIAKTIKRGF